MILCVSANPAIDVRLHVAQLKVGGVQRASSASRLAGGKAVHVALAARALGEAVTLVGWFGGAAGDACRAQLAELGLPTVAVSTLAETRQNLEIVADHGASTEILESGGPVDRADVERLLEACGRLLSELGPSDAVVLSGSLPRGAPLDLFARLVTLARGRGVPTLVDTSGPALDAALSAGPDWIKPNHDEASALLSRPVVDAPSALEAARALQARGAAKVMVSLGSQGLVAADETNAYAARAPRLDARSSVGCGDAAVAGLAVATLRGRSLVDTIKLAAACGHANCRADAPGRISPALVSQAESLVELARLSGGAA